MDQQTAFADIENALRRHATKREAFLEAMDAAVPWAELVASSRGGSAACSRRCSAPRTPRRRGPCTTWPATCRLKAAAVAEEAEPDALAYLGFPPSHWKLLRTSNAQERADREIKRRSRVVQVFPSEKSLERLVGAVMCEQDETWSESRYFAQEKTQELYDEKRAMAPAASETPAAELAAEARKMILASLELAERVEAA